MQESIEPPRDAGASGERTDLFVRLVALGLGDAIERFIGKTFAANEAADGNGFRLASHDALFIHLADVDLYRCMVFSSDNAIGSGAASAMGRVALA